MRQARRTAARGGGARRRSWPRGGLQRFSGGGRDGSRPARRRPTRTLTSAPPSGIIPARRGRSSAATSPVPASPRNGHGGPARVAGPPLDGAVYGQPLLVGSLVSRPPRATASTRSAPATGKVVWRTHVGTPVPLATCRAATSIRSASPARRLRPGRRPGLRGAETSGYHHVLFGISVADGAVEVERDIPAPDGQPRYDQQRPGLAIEDGRVYVAFGGL